VADTGDMNWSWMRVPDSPIKIYFPAKFFTRSSFENSSTRANEKLSYTPGGPKYGMRGFLSQGEIHDKSWDARFFPESLW
jgi:hypothetical protein